METTTFADTENSLDKVNNIKYVRGIDSNDKSVLISKEDLAMMLENILENERFALSLSKLSGYNCQYVTLSKGEEQKIPNNIRGLISIGYSPFAFNKVVKIDKDGNIETIINAWWDVSLRVDGKGDLYIKQDLWGSMRLRIVSL